MENRKLSLKAISRCHLNRLVALFAVFFLVSCFPGGESQQTGSIEQQMQIQQSTALSYARMFQQYAALSQQFLMRDVLGDVESPVEIPQTGLINGEAFSQRYSVTRAMEFLESAHCNGAEPYHLAWFKGDVHGSSGGQGGTVGGVVPRDLKGLGAGGYGSVINVLSREMSPGNYAVMEMADGVRRLRLGNGQVLQDLPSCYGLLEIPVATPVIVSPVRISSGERERSYYEYEQQPCQGQGDVGVVRFRRLVTQVYDLTTGQPQGESSIGEWESLGDSCQGIPTTPSISVEMQTVDVIDFASVGLTGTKEENCFEAKKIDPATGEDVLDESGNPIVFTNCEGSNFGYNPDLIPPGLTLANCVFLRVEDRTVPCAGGWSGQAVYERDINLCHVLDITTGMPTGETYEEAQPWRSESILCERPEETFFQCPYTSSTLRYTRTNTVTSFIEGTFQPGTPDNPDWVYMSGTCELTNVRDCNPRYLGNSLVADDEMPGTYSRSGTHDIPVNRRLNISTLCGAGVVCIEMRNPLDCPVDNMDGYRAEEREYACSAPNNGAWSHPDSDPWQEVFNNCNCTIWAEPEMTVVCDGTEEQTCPISGGQGATGGYASGSCAPEGSTCMNVVDVAPPGDLSGEGCVIAQIQYELTCTNTSDPALCACTVEVQQRASDRTSPANVNYTTFPATGVSTAGMPTCPVNQTGRITQARYQACETGTWSAWREVANTCSCPSSSAPSATEACAPADCGGVACYGTKTRTVTYNQATCSYSTGAWDISSCSSCSPGAPPVADYRYVPSDHPFPHYHLVCNESAVNPSYHPGGIHCSGPSCYEVMSSTCDFSGGTTCAAGQVGDRCYRREYLDTNIGCTSREGIGIVSANKLSHYECKNIAEAEACCTPYSEPVGGSYNVCPAGQSGRTCQDYQDYGCNPSTNTQTGPFAGTPVCSGTCTPDGPAEVCGGGWYDCTGSGMGYCNNATCSNSGGTNQCRVDATCPDTGGGECTPDTSEPCTPISCNTGETAVALSGTRTCQNDETWGACTGGQCQSRQWTPVGSFTACQMGNADCCGQPGTATFLTPDCGALGACAVLNQECKSTFEYVESHGGCFTCGGGCTPGGAAAAHYTSNHYRCQEVIRNLP